MAKVVFTAGRVAAFKCPPDKKQAFLWDATALGLGLRASPAGKPAYVFQRPFQGSEPRITIGSPDAWAIPQAREKARELQREIDEGRDPRQVKVAVVAAAVAKREADKGAGLTVAEVWPRYMANGKPKRRSAWKPRYVADLQKAASLGGQPKKRGKGVMKPGHLAALMPMALASIDQDVIRDWFASQAKTAPQGAARAVAMFSGFLGWCATQKDLRGLVDKDAARASQLGDVLPGVNKRKDALEIDQLPGWFAAALKLPNPTASAYLQVLVLTGARREELAALTWANVDFRWHKLTIADKVDTTRVIPLTPYVAALLAGLPRVNAFVFASPTAKSGRIAEPRSPHANVLAAAGIPHVSIHGLRRSFSLLGEEAGAPAGAIAQVMGHRPSGTTEDYRPRPMDALQRYLALIERFILDKAHVVFDPATAPAPSAALSLVA